MAIYGADIEALEGLANRFDTQKESMIGIVQQLTGELDGLLWQGPDAEAIRPEWTERLVRLIGIVEDTMGSIGLEAAQQAVEQRQASDV